MARSLTVCSEPGCAELVERGRCDAHRPTTPAKRDTRGDPHNQRRWKARSTGWRRRNPQCSVCGSLDRCQTDHVIPRQLLAAAGINDPDADRWLQTLCLRCHAVKTRRVDDRYLARLAAGEEPGQLCEWAQQAARQWRDASVVHRPTSPPPAAPIGDVGATPTPGGTP